MAIASRPSRHRVLRARNRLPERVDRAANELIGQSNQQQGISGSTMFAPPFSLVPGSVRARLAILEELRSNSSTAPPHHVPAALRHRPLVAAPAGPLRGGYGELPFESLATIRTRALLRYSLYDPGTCRQCAFGAANGAGFRSHALARDRQHRRDDLASRHVAARATNSQAMGGKAAGMRPSPRWLSFLLVLAGIQACR